MRYRKRTSAKTVDLSKADQEEYKHHDALSFVIGCQIARNSVPARQEYPCLQYRDETALPVKKDFTGTCQSGNTGYDDH